jgi:hypothetical protein
MDKTETLKEIFAEFCNSAVKIFHSYDEVMPLIFIFSREREMVRVIPIRGDKEAAARLAQDICLRVGAIAGVVVSEGWSVVFNKEAEWDGTAPSKHPDRVEILQVSLYSKSINRIKAWKVIREGKSKSLEDYWGEEPPSTLESRFFGNYFRADA